MEYGIYDAKTLMSETFSRIESESKNRKVVSGYSTGFFGLDSFKSDFYQLAQLYSAG